MLLTILRHHLIKMYHIKNQLQNGPVFPGTDRFKIFGKLELYQHHLYMRYLPSPFFGKDWEEALSQSHAVATGFSHQIEITFEIRNPGMKVTTCGARLVYEQDIEALIPNFIRSNQDIEDARQTKAECSSSIISITDGDVNRAVPCGEADQLLLSDFFRKTILRLQGLEQKGDGGRGEGKYLFPATSLSPKTTLQ
ncbi:hypothetical protein CMV_008784 [Castanea mollissima]|uniref:Uncharacterized protein n=1 Tax=Castanea mollissima TaxID=60419 RepID=A0A8J4RL91_9ROSI|nr:hypothetical protein CMV_008784 [Castanea mollissima]